MIQYFTLTRLFIAGLPLQAEIHCIVSSKSTFLKTACVVVTTFTLNVIAFYLTLK